MQPSIPFLAKYCNLISCQAAVISLFWFLPTLLWQGDPIPDGNDEVLEGEVDDNLENLVTKALRANFCPNCVLNIILVDTIIVSSLN